MSATVEDTVFFGKVVTINSADDIIRLTKSADVERLADTSRLGPAQALFENSAFFSVGVPYLPFTRDNDRDEAFLQRLHLMQDQMLEVNAKLLRTDLRRIAQMVHNNAPDDELLVEFAKLSANTFANVYEVSPEFLAQARKMPLVPDMLIPDNLFNLPTIKHAHDVTDRTAQSDILQLHNPIAATLLCNPLIRRVINEPHKSVNDIITETSPLQVVLRVTTRDTDLEGILSEKVPRDTLVLYNVRRAATETGSSAFTFGQGLTGPGARLCPFRKFIIPALEELRVEDSRMQGRPVARETDPNDSSVYDDRRDPL